MPLADYSFEADKWSNGQKNDHTVARKKGASYQLKWYKNPPYPFGEDVSTGRAKVKAERCTRLFELRKRMNSDLKSADGGAGVIGYATEVFLNLDENHPGVIEAVPFVAGVKDFATVRRNPAGLYTAMLSAAKAVDSMHARSIVHGDLKPDNILMVSVGAGGAEVRAVLIDFDSAYYEEDIPSPEDISGTPGYISPEVFSYMNDEEYEEEDGSDSRFYGQLTRARDIFSLGVIFHELITGAAPTFSEKGATIDRKKIGEAYLGDLIESMLESDPAQRPVAGDVYDAIQSRGESMATEPYQELWPEHESLYEYQSDLSRFRKIRRLDDCGSHRYQVHYASGQVRDYIIEMMVKARIVKKKGGEADVKAGSFVRNGCTYEADMLWPEHDGYRIDPEAMKKRGYAILYRVTDGTSRNYAVYKRGQGYLDRSFRVLTFEKCVVLK